MRVLVACEESQAVTKEFRRLGHDAFSCDTRPCSGGHPEWHIKDNVLYHLDSGWDLMIGHPPCTYLANAGLHYLKTRPQRKDQLKKAFCFVKSLYNSSIEKIALENPIGWLNTNWRKPDQIIQPYYFGEEALKTTCLWLKNLSLLDYWLEDDLFGKKTATKKPKPNGCVIRKSGKQRGRKYNYYWRQGKTAKQRSKTFPGIAKAMAEQWG